MMKPLKKTVGLLLILMMAIMLFPISSLVASEEDEQNLTVDEALVIALSHNKELMKLRSSIDEKDILRDDAEEYVKFTPMDESYPSGYDSVMKSYYSADYDLRSAKKGYEYEKQNTAINTKNAYFAVKVAQLKCLAAQENLRLNELKLRQENARFNVGTSTNAQLEASKSILAGARANLTDAQKSLDSTYVELNKLLDYEADARPVLTSEPEFKPAQIKDVETVVSKALNNSYAIWSKEQVVDLNKKLKIYYKFYDVGEEKESQSELDLSSAKDDMGQQVRDLCNNIKYLEAAYTNLRQQQATANEALRVLKAQKDVGMVTVDAVLEKEYNVKNVDAGINEVIVGHMEAVNGLKLLTGEAVYEEASDKNKASSDEAKNKNSEESSKTESTSPPVVKKNSAFWVGSDKYYDQGTFKLMNTKPYVKDGRTYVPVRYLAYAMGLTENDIVWDAETNTVRLTKGEKWVSLAIGSNTITADGVPRTMDVAPEIVAGSTMLPARYVAEGFGYEVNWDSEAQMVQIK